MHTEIEDMGHNLALAIHKAIRQVLGCRKLDCYTCTCISGVHAPDTGVGHQ